MKLSTFRILACILVLVLLDSEVGLAQNLISNPRFDVNVASWNAGSNNGTIAFQVPPDANGGASGSLGLTSQNFAAGAAHGYAFQCKTLSVAAGWPLRVSAKARRVSGAEVDHVVVFSSTPGCSSAASATNYILFADHGSGGGAWHNSSGTLRALSGAVAVEVGLSVVCATGPCVAGLDDVIVEPALFWNSFE